MRLAGLPDSNQQRALPYPWDFSHADQEPRPRASFSSTPLSCDKLRSGCRAIEGAYPHYILIRPCNICIGVAHR